MVRAETADGVLGENVTDGVTVDFNRLFLENYNKRELQYAECDVLIDQQDPFNGQGVLTIFARSLIAATGLNPTLELIFEASRSAMEAIKRLELPKRVPDTNRHLDEAERHIERERRRQSGH